VRKLGLDVVRYDDVSPRDRIRARILSERAIDVVLDVGANEGQYALTLRSLGYRGRIVSFEPLSAAFTRLEDVSAHDAGWECVRVALGERSDHATLNVAANSWSSSLRTTEARLVEADPETAFVDSEECEVTTLDILRGQLVRPDERAFLKLDVQGYELEVLQGAEETLRQVEALDVELAVVRLYQGAPLLSDVVRHLDERGFGLVSIDPGFTQRRTGAILEVDGLFARL
jgi:FkbM family methyltransferase